MADTAGMPDMFAMLRSAAYLQTHPGQQTLVTFCSSEANLTCALCECHLGFAVRVLGLKRCISGTLLGQTSRAHNVIVRLCYYASMVECVTKQEAAEQETAEQKAASIAWQPLAWQSLAWQPQMTQCTTVAGDHQLHTAGNAVAHIC